MWPGSLDRLSLVGRAYLASTAGCDDNAAEDIARLLTLKLMLSPHRCHRRRRRSRAARVLKMVAVDIPIAGTMQYDRDGHET